MLKLEHIKKSYDGVNILNDINLEIADGEIVSILGRQKYMVVSRLMGDGALQTFYITVFQQGKCGCDDDAHSIHRQYSVPELSGKYNIRYNKISLMELKKNRIRDIVFGGLSIALCVMVLSILQSSFSFRLYRTGRTSRYRIFFHRMASHSGAGFRVRGGWHKRCTKRYL